MIFCWPGPGKALGSFNEAYISHIVSNLSFLTHSDLRAGRVRSGAKRERERERERKREREKERKRRVLRRKRNEI